MRCPVWAIADAGQEQRYAGVCALGVCLCHGSRGPRVLGCLMRHACAMSETPCASGLGCVMLGTGLEDARYWPMPCPVLPYAMSGTALCDVRYWPILLDVLCGTEARCAVPGPSREEDRGSRRVRASSSSRPF
eukprot:370699-Rhodomonas_salina.1